jgi:hypothetical protein
MDKVIEQAKWHCRYRLSKYREDIEPYRGHEADFHKRFRPFEVIEGEGNCLLNVGIAEMLDLIIGEVSGADHIFDNTGAQIGVGDSSTAANASQTDLLGDPNKTYKGMEATFPSRASQTVSFKSSFGSGDANYAWNEWVIKQSTSAKCLNRKVDSMGTKSGGTWTLEVSITLS